MLLSEAGSRTGVPVDDVADDDDDDNDDEGSSRDGGACRGDAIGRRGSLPLVTCSLYLP